mgnify:CR=1 FL=1
MNDTVRARMRHIAAARLRRDLYWYRMRGRIPDEGMLEEIISTGVWRVWNMRLVDWLTAELGVPRERAIDLTAEAIKKGHEDGKLYGIDSSPTQPA